MSGCTTRLAQGEYKKRHDKVALRLHWELCQTYGFDHPKHWYEHVPEMVVENNEVKLLWYMTIFTDRKIIHNRPDIVIVDKIDRVCTLIDIAVPSDANIPDTGKRKIEKYQDLSIEIERIHTVKAKVIPIVVGALGTVSKDLKNYLGSLNMGDLLGCIQMAAILGSAHILRKVLRL